MKKLLQYLKARRKKIYFVSGIFSLHGERKWFRVLYQPESGYVNEKEVEIIFNKQLRVSFDYFIITNYKRISFNEYKNFSNR